VKNKTSSSEGETILNYDQPINQRNGCPWKERELWCWFLDRSIVEDFNYQNSGFLDNDK
jgi:hypothetical protein